MRTPWATGQDAGRFFPFGNDADLPPDQRAEDGRSVCIDLPVGDEPIDLLGEPSLRVRLRSDHDRGHLIVRLCDVAPDGASTLVTRGVLNLLKRDGMDRIDPLVPGEDVDVRVPLVAAGYRFEPGHRIRVALANHYWPWVWPHAVVDTLNVDLDATELDLPLVPESVAPVHFEPAEHARPIGARPIPPAQPIVSRVVEYDVAAGRTTLRVDPHYGGSRYYPDRLSFLESTAETYVVCEGDPDSPQAESRWTIRLTHPDGWSAEVETQLEITSDAADFRVRSQVLAFATRVGEREQVAARTLDDRVPRTST